MSPSIRCALAVLLGILPASLGAQEVAVILDPAKPGPEIHPYLYGQFIEHLGRCVRDGIWAEKLRDRKFLLPPLRPWDPRKPEKPAYWTAFRGEGAEADVFQEAAAAYAGEQGLAVWVRDPKGGCCGIRQEGLGVVAGEEYVGRAVLAHAGAAGPVEVRLSWGPAEGDGQSVILDGVGSAYGTFPFRFRTGGTTDNASLSIGIRHRGCLWIGAVSLMPADHVRGMRADTLDLIRRLAPPITRWPGGNFVSGYHWRDAIGDRDRRPPRWERAWNDVEDNDFGIDEFMAFCAEVKTEPYVAVNTGLGSAEEAADEVEYANGAATTRWGAERARNGHPGPYGVVWWGIGNEMYGNWQLGNVPVERYSLRHNAFVRAMRARDPGIRVIAVGNPGRWNDVMIPACAAGTDLWSGHHYTERRLRVPLSPEDLKRYEEKFSRYSGEVAGGIRRLVADLRRRQGRGDAEVDRLRLAVDEWGIVRDWNPAPDGPGVGAFEHYYPLGDALAAARAVHELLRSADTVAMANWAQAVNVIGAIKTSRTRAVLDAVGHVLALYRARLGGALVPLEVAGEAPVDAVAARDRGAGTIGVGLVNYAPDRGIPVRIRLGDGGPPSAAGWRINGPHLGAVNIPGRPEEVTTGALEGPLPLDRPVLLPAHSITVLTFRDRP